MLLIQRIIPHYRYSVFKKMLLKLPDLTIVYSKKAPTESIDNFKGIDDINIIKKKVLYIKKDGTIFFQSLLGYILKTKPKVVITVFNIGNLFLYLLFFLRPFLRYKIILWSFGYDPILGFNPKKYFKDKVRLFLYQKSDASIFYWERGKEEVSKFSKKTKHYFVAPNTIDTNRLVNIKAELDVITKKKLKEELNVKNKYHLIYVGRLLKDKEIPLLIKAFQMINKDEFDCRLSIVGDGPERKNLETIVKKLLLKNVYFLGEILDEKIVGKWIYISDAFVMPGRLGNSVVHSFCFGVPVISQKKDYFYHGEGIGYMKDNFNGFLCPDNNPKIMSERMEQLFKDYDLQKTLKKNAFLSVQNECSVEKFLEGFCNAINSVK